MVCWLLTLLIRAQGVELEIDGPADFIPGAQNEIPAENNLEAAEQIAANLWG